MDQLVPLFVHFVFLSLPLSLPLSHAHAKHNILLLPINSLPLVLVCSDGNVAAGSDNSGFFFETHLKVHGESVYQAPDLIPKFTPLGQFDNNKAHSCDRIGFTSYPPGYQPSEPGHIYNLRVYRNKRWGMFLHNTRNLIFTNLYVANNALAIYNLRGDDITIQDSRIVGMGPNEPLPPSCARGFSILGMILHPTKFHERDRTGTIRGSTLHNVVFEGFSNLRCNDSTAHPFVIGTEQSWTPAFDAPHTLSRVSIEDDVPVPLEGCAVRDVLNMRNIALEVTNDRGVLSDSSLGANAFLVSEKLLEIMPEGSCDDAGGCMYRCPNTCFRTVLYVTANSVAGISLVITDKVTNRRHTMTGAMRETPFSAPNRAFPFADEIYSTSLPYGQYTAHFEDANGQHVWPGYVQEVFEAPPRSCTEYIDSANVELLPPPLSNGRCDELIAAGTFDGDVSSSDSRALEPWQDLLAGLVLKPNGGINNSGSLQTTVASPRTLIVQYIDPTCLVAGSTYEFSMSFKMVDKDGNVIEACGNGKRCPRAAVLLEQLNPETNKYEAVGGSLQQVGRLEGTYQQSNTEFNRLVGTWTVSSEQAWADKARFMIDRGDGLYVIDNVSLKRLAV